MTEHPPDNLVTKNPTESFGGAEGSRLLPRPGDRRPSIEVTPALATGTSAANSKQTIENQLLTSANFFPPPSVDRLETASSRRRSMLKPSFVPMHREDADDDDDDFVADGEEQEETERDNSIFYLNEEWIRNPSALYQHISSNFGPLKIIEHEKGGLVAGNIEGFVLYTTGSSDIKVFLIDLKLKSVEQTLEPGVELNNLKGLIPIEHFNNKKWVKRPPKFIMWDSSRVFLCSEGVVRDVGVRFPEGRSIKKVIAKFTEKGKTMIILTNDPYFIKYQDINNLIQHPQVLEIGEKINNVFSKSYYFVEVYEENFRVVTPDENPMLFPYETDPNCEVEDVYFSIKHNWLFYLQREEDFLYLVVSKRYSDAPEHLFNWTKTRKAWICGNFFDRKLFIFIQVEIVCRFIYWWIDDIGSSSFKPIESFVISPNQLVQQDDFRYLKIQNVHVVNEKKILLRLTNVLNIEKHFFCILYIDKSRFEKSSISSSTPPSLLNHPMILRKMLINPASKDVEELSASINMLKLEQEILLFTIKPEFIISITRKGFVKMFNLSKDFEEVEFVNPEFPNDIRKYLWVSENNVSSSYDDFVLTREVLKIDSSEDGRNVLVGFSDRLIVATCLRHYATVFRMHLRIYRSMSANSDFTRFAFADAHFSLRVFNRESIELNVPENFPQVEEIYDTVDRSHFCAWSKRDQILVISFDNISILHEYNIRHSPNYLSKISCALFDEEFQSILIKDETGYHITQKRTMISFQELKALYYMLLSFRDINSNFPATYIIEELEREIVHSNFLREYFHPITILLLQQRPANYTNFLKTLSDFSTKVKYPTSTVQKGPIELADELGQEASLYAIVDFLLAQESPPYLTQKEMRILYEYESEKISLLLAKCVYEFTCYEQTDLTINNSLNLPNSIYKISQAYPYFSMANYYWLTGRLDSMSQHDLEFVNFFRDESASQEEQKNDNFCHELARKRLKQSRSSTSKLRIQKNPDAFLSMIHQKTFATYYKQRNNNIQANSMFKSSEDIALLSSEEQNKGHANKIGATPWRFYKMNCDIDLSMGTRSLHQFLKFYIESSDRLFIFSPWKLVVEKKWQDVRKVYILHAMFTALVLGLYIAAMWNPFSRAVMLAIIPVFSIHGVYIFINVFMNPIGYFRHYDNIVEIGGFVLSSITVFSGYHRSNHRYWLTVIRLIGYMLTYANFLLHLKFLESIYAIIIMTFVAIKKVTAVLIVMILVVFGIGVMAGIVNNIDVWSGTVEAFFTLTSGIESLGYRDFNQWVLTVSDFIFLYMILFNFVLAKIYIVWDEIEEIKDIIVTHNQAMVVDDYSNLYRFWLILLKLLKMKKYNTIGHGRNIYVREMNPCHNIFVTRKFEGLRLSGFDLDDKQVETVRIGVEKYNSQKDSEVKKLTEEIQLMKNIIIDQQEENEALKAKQKKTKKAGDHAIDQILTENLASKKEVKDLRKRIERKIAKQFSKMRKILRKDGHEKGSGINGRGRSVSIESYISNSESEEILESSSIEESDSEGKHSQDSEHSLSDSDPKATSNAHRISKKEQHHHHSNPESNLSLDSSVSNAAPCFEVDTEERQLSRQNFTVEEQDAFFGESHLFARQIFEDLLRDPRSLRASRERLLSVVKIRIALMKKMKVGNVDRKLAEETLANLERIIKGFRCSVADRRTRVAEILGQYRPKTG